MHTPWAGSNRYKISELMSFTAERPLPVDSPSLPFWARFNEPLRRRRQYYGFTRSYRFAATLDTGPLAKSYPRGSHTRLSSKHFQSARACIVLPPLLHDRFAACIPVLNGCIVKKLFQGFNIIVHFEFILSRCYRKQPENMDVVAIGVAYLKFRAKQKGC